MNGERNWPVYENTITPWPSKDSSKQCKKYINIIYPISISIDIEKPFIKIYYLVLIWG